MNPQVMVQGTPNPNALKFVLNVPVKISGNWTYKSINECVNNPLAAAVFEMDQHVREVYFFDNYITVTQDGSASWEDLEDRIRAAILVKIVDHNPDFHTPESQSKVKAVDQQSPQLAQINTILDQTVRPALQMDGGDILLLDYRDNILRVAYEGACGSCPSATMGTLKAIENILKDQFNPDLTVELANSFYGGDTYE